VSNFSLRYVQPEVLVHNYYVIIFTLMYVNIHLLRENVYELYIYTLCYVNINLGSCHVTCSG